MARGSLWDKLGRDREQRRCSEVARVRAEAQIRKDDRRSIAGTRRGDAAHERAERDAEAVRRQTELDARLTALAGVLRAVVALPIPTLSDLRDLPPEVEPEPFDEEPPRWADFAPPEPGFLGRLGHNHAVAQARTRFDEEFAEFERRRAAAAERVRSRGPQWTRRPPAGGRGTGRRGRTPGHRRRPGGAGVAPRRHTPDRRADRTQAR
jgi:hypothetical protein